jgi:hypothetical protein
MGAVPPVICRLALYGVLTIALVSGDVVMMDGSALQCTVRPVTLVKAGVGNELSVTE